MKLNKYYDNNYLSYDSCILFAVSLNLYYTIQEVST